MVIDPGKVDLKEKDIEDYLWNNPSAVQFGELVVDRWLARQYEVPSGIIDLLGTTEDHEFVVVEVKNVAVDASALTQVSRYAHDIIMASHSVYLQNTSARRMPPFVYKIVIGRSIDTKTMLEAEALKVFVMAFQVEFLLSASPVRWTPGYYATRVQKLMEMQNSEAITSVVGSYIEKGRYAAEDNDLGGDDGSEEELEEELQAEV